MSGDPIPDTVRRLLARRFRSISQVEAFVLLVREGRSLEADAVASALGLGTRHVEGLLDELVSKRLLTRSADGYGTAPLSAKDREAAEHLVRLYAPYRLRIMDIVLAVPRDQARDFADAFRLRPDDSDDEDE